MAVILCIYDIMCNFCSTCNLEKISESTNPDWDSRKKIGQIGQSNYRSRSHF